MSDIGWDMIGTKGGKRPLFTLAGRLYARPAITHNLPYKHFAVSDNVLSHDEIETRLSALSKLIEAHYATDQIDNLEDVPDDNQDT